MDGLPSANIITASAAGVINVSYSFTDASTGCTTIATHAINVNALPNVNIPASATYCSNAGNVILPGGAPIGGIYSGLGVLNDSIFYPSLIAGNSTIIQYNYTDVNGCVGSATQNITLTPAPVVSVVIPRHCLFRWWFD